MKASWIFFFPLLLPALAESSFLPGTDLAWAPNSGWISFRHDRPSSPAGIVFGESHLQGLAWSANLGWIDFGDGSPDNGHSYSNSGSDHGVNHDGQGNLSGFAWCANAGWIQFGWAELTDPNRPRVNLLTGAFQGFAWSANTGWLSLGTGFLTAESMERPDADGDGLPDAWEMKHFGNLITATATSDTDGDGSSDLAESEADTIPTDPDSRFRIVSQSHQPTLGTVNLAFTSTPSRLYQVEHSPDLGIVETWTATSEGTITPSTGSVTSGAFSHPPGDIRFFRVRSIVPLQP